MIGITEASAALSSIKTAMDMLKGVQSLKNESDINLAIIGIQRTLLDAQAAALQDREIQMLLLSHVDDLNKKLSTKDAWEDDKKRYALQEFPTGKLAYVLKENARNGEPSHRLCVACFNDNKKSVLQTKNRHSGGESVVCPHCKDVMILSAFPPVDPYSGRRDGWAGSRYR